ncbi:MAG: hypothetical protein KKG47_01395 [Proteobacteria bacterium]|nr:hypothetical protein [Pseudomonadota bacterium]MBU1736721.1 hypothetical protein [Pseudomonadota bacterium]
MWKEIITGLAVLLATAPCLAGDPVRGERLFSDPSFGNGTSGKTCLTCHEKGLDLGVDLMGKRNFEIMGVMVANPSEAVNFCIEVALRGEGLDLQSEEMSDILSFLEILALKGGGKKYSP